MYLGLTLIVCSVIIESLNSALMDVNEFFNNEIDKFGIILEDNFDAHVAYVQSYMNDYLKENIGTYDEDTLCYMMARRQIF